MFAYMVLRDTDPSDRTVVFMQGNFTESLFALLILPFARQEAVEMPGNLWIWHGTDTCLSLVIESY